MTAPARRSSSSLVGSKRPSAAASLLSLNALRKFLACTDLTTCEDAKTRRKREQRTSEHAAVALLRAAPHATPSLSATPELVRR